MTADYDFAAIQRHWRQVWDRLGPRSEPGGPRRYLVDMFAYPSGDLHMGHAEAYAIGDALARYWTQRGYHVLHSVGWDSFGLPAENAAIRRDQHPADWTYANIATQAESFRRYAVSGFGHQPSVAHAGWPAIDPALAAVPTVICAIQVNGKLRDRLEVPGDISAADLEARALAFPAAGGRPVIRTVVRPLKLVNLVVQD